MTGRLVVIGGGAAGMSAASAARRTDEDLKITVLEATGYASWGLCGIPYYVAGLVPNPQGLVSVTPEEFRNVRDIDLRLHSRVSTIDADSHTVSVEPGGERIEYDKLVVAAGASPLRPPIPGVHGSSVHVVRSLEGAIALRRCIEEGRVRRALVVGAGYIGLEMADALVESGVAVTVVERLTRVMPTLDSPMADLVEQEVRRHVDLRLATAVTAIDSAGANLDDGRRIDVDAIVMAAGIRPGSLEAAAAGAQVTESGALVVDASMRTTLTDVFAAGDCVAVEHLVLGRPTHIPLGPTANKTGRVAGIVAAGGEARFAGILGTAVAKIFELTVARTGLTREEADGAGIEALVADSTTASKARYYPGVAPIHTRVVFRPDGRLLGAQMVSTDPATAKRIDVVATALHAHFDVHELAELDLSYAPPYAPVYDPVVRAAQSAVKVVA